ncbi:MAG: recombination-associated protein RdgC [Desulfovibrionaceae bacterium]|nr:recombination-associated protein RdgC [Desulfovibrionaceae bacterium]
MSLLSSSLGLTRFRVVEDADQALLRRVPDLLKKFAFRDIDDSAEERSFGWTNIDDMLDTNWEKSPPEKGRFLAFSLRLETRRVQPAVLKKHLRIALDQESARAKDQGRNFVSRDRKRELKEQVFLRLRARSLPIPAVFDALWDHQAGRVLLATTNAKARALFEDHFTLSFGLRLEPLSPFFLALDILGEDKARKIENLEPTVFI